MDRLTWYGMTRMPRLRGVFLLVAGGGLAGLAWASCCSSQPSVLRAASVPLPPAPAPLSRPTDGTHAHGESAPMVSSGSRDTDAGYQITELGTLGGSFSAAYGIDRAGRVLGQSRITGTTYHAFTYAEGRLTDLGTLPGGDYSTARAGNAAGDVVGLSFRPDRAPRAFLYRVGTMQDLGTLGGSSSEAYGINDAGQVVGIADLAAYAGSHAFLWSAAGMRDLGTLGGRDSQAFAINAAGDVVGASTTSSWYRRAFLYRGATMRDLGTLGGPESLARDINDVGCVVGEADTPDGAQHAFLLVRPGAAMKDLGTLGGRFSEAHGINADGDVVGHAQTARGTQHAFLYAGGVLRDLNHLLPKASGWLLDEAWDISDDGCIVGAGVLRGRRRAFLLSPHAP